MITSLIVLSITLFCVLSYVKFSSIRLNKEYEKTKREHKNILVDMERKLDIANSNNTALNVTLKQAKEREEKFEYHLNRITSAYGRLISAILEENPEAKNTVFKFKQVGAGPVQVVTSLMDRNNSNYFDEHPASLTVRQKYEEINMIDISFYKNHSNDVYNFVVYQKDSPGFIVSLSPDILLTLKNNEEVLMFIYQRLVDALYDQKFKFRY